MATIRERGGRFCVIYNYVDDNGKRRQKWETYKTKTEAKKRKKEIEYKKDKGIFFVPKCDTLRELLDEYVRVYGKDKWAVSTHHNNVSVIRNYIVPMIGDTKLSDISIRFLEAYYQQLLTTPAVINPYGGNRKERNVGTSTIRDIHKVLRSCFEQVVKWELMEKNPAIHASVPKHKPEKRDIWTAQTLMDALETCDDEVLKLSLNLAFSASLRIGELLGLTWDCVDISDSAIRERRPYIFINKELQRVSKESLISLDGKDVLLVFPENSKRCKTVCVLKTPKTENSVRKVFIPCSVAAMLKEHKAAQDELRSLLGEEYHDFNLVMATSFGMPQGAGALRKKLKKLISDNNLPDIVFHSMRHTSVTYKLKLSGGDIKAVQGDSGHSQVNMVTDVYSHIIDEDRRHNAELFEEAFYGKKNLDPKMHPSQAENMLALPEGVNADLLAKVLANPEMAALLTSLAKAIDTKEEA